MKLIILIFALYSTIFSQDFFTVNDSLMAIGKLDEVESNAVNQLRKNNESYEAAYFLTLIGFKKNPELNCIGKQIYKPECSEILKYMTIFEKNYRKKAQELKLMYQDQIMMADVRFMKLFYLIGLKYFDERNFSKAAEWLNLAKTMYRNDFNLFFYLGTSYLVLEKYDKALDSYKEAIKLNPEDSAVYYNIACLYGKKDDAYQAAEWLKKAIQLNPDYKVKYMTDSDFDTVRDREEFKKLANNLK